ncbi:leucine zipper transcription factor-like protein 1 [Anabrus simplex]|uniref:leucine zipper transcription factor-like protein 1 n=1 Tax=Anabrus simplex TaxID=316456 RepID=UPI0035A3592A
MFIFGWGYELILTLEASAYYLCLYTYKSEFQEMANLGLNEHHQEVVTNYMRFARYQRAQNLKAIEYTFKNALETRLLEDTYTAEEVQEMLTDLSQVVRGDVETELINFSHLNLLLLKQLFIQAEKWHLRLQADLSELENRDQLENIKAMEELEFPSLKIEKAPPTPTKVKLRPINERSGSVPLLHMEIERLKEENNKLTQAVIETQEMAAKYLQEINQLKNDLEVMKKELSEKQEIVHIPQDNSQLQEVERELKEVRNLLSTNMEASVSSQHKLELELTSTKHKFEEVQSLLLLAEQELERKFSETAAYSNMKKMLTKKNEQIKELRKKLQEYQIEDDGKED